MKLPYIDAHSTPIKINMSTTRGRLSIEQASATLDIKSTPARLDIESKQPVVVIDLSNTWDALTGGTPLKFMERIYNQQGQYVYEGISRKIQQYEQIGDLRIKQNPIPQIAKSNAFERSFTLQVYGPASGMNVSFTADIAAPQVQYTPGKVDADITPNYPVMNHSPGEVKFYTEQYPFVEITVKNAQ